MDTSPLTGLTYGLYIIGAFHEGRPVGCVVNTCFQLTSRNPLLAVSLNKQNFTLEAIREHKRFSVSILAEDSDPSLIGRFGFFSSRDTDKYSSFGFDVIGFVPCVRGKFAGRLILEAESFVDCETHVLVIARLIDTAPGDGIPMTYAYYHDVIKGKSPRNAPTYRPDASTASAGKSVYRCDICNYETESDGPLPDGYVCPVCGADASHFKAV